MILAGQILNAAEALEIVDACPKLPRAVVALLSRGGGGALPLLVLPEDMQWDAGYEAALGTLKKQDLQTAVSQADHGSNTRSQSYKVTVRLTMEAVCLLKGVEPSWAAGKALLGDRHFVQSLQEFDKDRIPETTLAKLQKYIQMEDFRPEVVRRAGGSAAGLLCQWVLAIDNQSKVARQLRRIGQLAAQLGGASDGAGILVLLPATADRPWGPYKYKGLSCGTVSS